MMGNTQITRHQWRGQLPISHDDNDIYPDTQASTTGLKHSMVLPHSRYDLVWSTVRRGTHRKYPCVVQTIQAGPLD